MIYDSINFGNRVAEDEESQLPNYFLNTRYWKNLYSGKTDVILGPKGAGKSALYLNLINKTFELKNRNIILLKAENPRGETIFSLFNQMTATQKYESPQAEFLIEKDISKFWELYFLTIIVTELKKENYREDNFNRVIKLFEECGLIPQEKSLKNIFRHVVHYLKQIITLQAFQTEIEFDTNTFAVKAIKGKIAFEELTPKKIQEGHLTLNDLFELINHSLSQTNNKIWIAIDRLDIAFKEDILLEKRALKSLFNVYNSLKSFENIQLKIFLRNDIWDKITIDGLREASHITKKETIVWGNNNTFNLIQKRIVNNAAICNLYGKNEKDILADIKLQEQLFEKLFPLNMENNAGNKTNTFFWILTILKDGNDLYTPREVIHFLNEVNTIQADLIEFGKKNNEGTLYTKEALKEAIREVARVKFEQTLLAENPNLAGIIKQSFKYAPTIINSDWIKKTFGILDDTKAHEQCEPFQQVGFLKRLNAEEYRIPYLYQVAINL